MEQQVNLEEVCAWGNWMLKEKDISRAYARWAEALYDRGWEGYLLTFMFRQIAGPTFHVARQMEQEVERIYATLLTRIVRKPHAPSMRGKLPIWFCSLDRPVAKRSKQSLRDLVPNDGQHAHAVAFVPPWSRLDEALDQHIDRHWRQLIRPGLPLIRLDAVPITHNPGYVVGYARKYTGHSLLGQDVSFILPRTSDEVADRTA